MGLHWIQKLKNLRKKQIVLGLLCALLLLTPSIFAFIHIYQVDNKENDQELTVILYDAEGREIGKESGTPALSDEYSLLSVFSQMDQLTEPLTDSIIDYPSDTYVRAKLIQKQSQQEFTCYFSISKVLPLCLDSNGEVFVIDSELNRRFLRSVYGEVFFPSSTPPALLTIDGDTVLPSTLSWNYKVDDNLFLPSKQEHLLSADSLYEITGEIGLRFSAEPDRCVVTIWDDGQIIFQDRHSELSQLTVNTGNVLDVQVDARWSKTEDAECYGNLTYTFRVHIKNPSEFSISSQEVRPGGIVTLSCTNVSDPKKIQFTSDQITSPVPFYRDGDLYRAFLLIPEDTQLRELPFRISYGASAHEFTLQIAEKASEQIFHYPLLDFPDSALTHMDGLAYLKSEFGRLNGVFDSDMIYFRGNNKDPSQDGFEIGYTHGSTVFWSEDKTDSFLAAGTEYRTRSGIPQAVAVWGNGVVIQTGTDDLLGNYVIVDHGGGILTWYGHLSITSVSRGTVVRQGELLGQTGEGGLSTGNGYLFLCSVHNQFVDPQILFDGLF